MLLLVLLLVLFYPIYHPVSPLFQSKYIITMILILLFTPFFITRIYFNNKHTKINSFFIFILFTLFFATLCIKHTIFQWWTTPFSLPPETYTYYILVQHYVYIYIEKNKIEIFQAPTFINKTFSQHSYPHIAKPNSAKRHPWWV